MIAISTRARWPGHAGHRQPDVRWQQHRPPDRAADAPQLNARGESKSSISRAMRSAWTCMMSRKRSRAAASSRAGPCNVSMKPESAASGVRSSWLALATKSARISSTRRSGVWSWNVSSTRSPADIHSGKDIGTAMTSYQRSTGTRSKNSACCALRLARARRITCSTSGARSEAKPIARDAAREQSQSPLRCAITSSRRLRAITG